MKVQNIDRVLLFRKDVNQNVLTLEELQAKYKFDPDGTNFYYGINQTNLDNFTTNGTALNQSHQLFLRALLASITNSPDDEKTLMLGVEPPDVDPYGFVSANLPLIRKLAVELAAVQSSALDAGKRLNISIRYASEMNAGESKWGDKAGYKSTFVQVRQAFAQAAPSILFSFSPALRADIDESMIADYWPGDKQVDIVGGTWYTRTQAQQAASRATMRSYFLHRTGAGKPFALSELGGCTANDKGNDAQLQSMFHDLEALQLQNVSFKYVTIFLEQYWGYDATLGFLAGR